MKAIFMPFIGTKYDNQSNKILVLGESHYLNEMEIKDFEINRSELENFTKNVLAHYFEYRRIGKGFGRWMNTFTKFPNVLYGRKLSSDEAIDFWNKCCFYNYIQFPLSGPRISPTMQQFEESYNMFTKIIEELKPDLIIVWGLRLSQQIPQKLIETKAQLLVVPHPSSSKFNYSLTKSIKSVIKL